MEVTSSSRRGPLSDFLLFWVLLAISAVFNPQITPAQVPTAITPDGTLGTVVTPNTNVHDITGGTRPGDGPNLFHSFDQFSVGTGDVAHFLNDTGLSTENILSRVTGGDPSQIFGTIQTTDFGNANLFLMNPAGVLFGQSASLNIGGSFHVTTADYLRFENGTTLYADMSLDGSTDSILQVASVEEFGFLGDPTTVGFTSASPAPITIDQSLLQVPPTQTLSVIGGDLAFGSAIENEPIVSPTTLRAESGRINAISVASSGEVSGSLVDSPTNLLLDTFTTLGRITLNSGTAFNVTGDPGGMVLIRAGQLVVQDALIDAGSVGETNHNGTGIDVQVTESIVAQNGRLSTPSQDVGRGGDILLAAPNIRLVGGKVEAETQGTGPGGNIEVTVNELQLFEGAIIRSSTQGEGPAGKIEINATDTLIIAGKNSGVLSNTTSSGNGGDIAIHSQTVQLIDFALLNARSSSSGNSGNIRLEAEGMILLEDSQIISDSKEANAGTIELLGQSDIKLTKSNIRASVTGGEGRGGDTVLSAPMITLTGGKIEAETHGMGPAGNIAVHVRELMLTDGAQIKSSTQSEGAGGTVTVTGFEGPETAAHTVVITGSDPELPRASGRSRIQSEGSAQGGDGGQVLVKAQTLRLEDIGQIDTSTRTGQSGGIDVHVDTLVVSGNAQLSSGVRGEGVAGMISVMGLEGPGTFAEVVRVENEGTISSSGNDGGVPGIVVVDAKQVAVTNRGQINTNALRVREEQGDTNLLQNDLVGSVSITATESLTISGRVPGRNIRSGVFSRTTGRVDAGKIQINTPVLVLEDGAEIATRSEGRDIHVGEGEQTGAAGIIELDVGSLSITGGGRIDSSVRGPARGIGNVNITATETISISGERSGVFSQTRGEGAGGKILVQGNQVHLTDGAIISAKSSGLSAESLTDRGPAGDILLSASQTFTTNRSVITSSADQADGGDVILTAGGDLFLTNKTLVTAETSGLGDAGDILFDAADSILLANSAVSTIAEQADGGNIKLTAADLIHFTDSQVTSSVGGGPTTVGGNINVDPQFIILQNSQILAQAFAGQGGDITLTAGVVLADSFSTIDASSDLGINGSVNIQASIQQLSETVAPLPETIVSVAALYAQRCAAQRNGQFSSLVLGNHEGLPPTPGRFLPSPLTLESFGMSQTPQGTTSIQNLNALQLGFKDMMEGTRLELHNQLIFSKLDQGCSSYYQ